MLLKKKIQEYVKMNKRQRETLLRKFKEQQKLNLKVFLVELSEKAIFMDYKEENLNLELGIHNSKKTLKNLKELEKLNKEINKNDCEPLVLKEN